MNNVVTTKYYTGFPKLLKAMSNPLFYVMGFKGNSKLFKKWCNADNFNTAKHYYKRISLFYFSMYIDGKQTTGAYDLIYNKVWGGSCDGQ